MDKNNVELFAQTYPKGPAHSFPTGSTPGMLRTPLKDIIIEEGFHSKKTVTPKQAMSPAAKEGTKKFLAILLITLIGAFMYSAFAYTISDSLFEKFDINFFSPTGQPGAAIIAIHSIIYIIIIYVILNTLK